MDKDVPHMYSGILLSHKKNENAIGSNMDDLQIIILSKESQKEKYHMVFTSMWLSNIPLCICDTSSLSIPLSMVM